MVLKPKALWQQRFQTTHATLDVEEPVAGGAVEVVVVLGCDGSGLVAIAPPGHGDVHDLSALLKAANNPVDRSESKGPDLGRCGRVDLFNREGAFGSLERVLDGNQLFGGSLFRHQAGFFFRELNSTL